MERLTFEGNFCEISRCEGEYRMCSLCEHGACDSRKVWERLKEYEDTGLTPEEIRELVHDTYGPLHKKLGEWIKAESDGRLSVPPLKIGDDIWWIDDEAPFVKCDKGGVRGIASLPDGIRVINRDGEFEEIGTRYCYLTKEDAEKALATDINVGRKEEGEADGEGHI